MESMKVWNHKQVMDKHEFMKSMNWSKKSWIIHNFMDEHDFIETYQFMESMISFFKSCNLL